MDESSYIGSIDTANIAAPRPQASEREKQRANRREWATVIKPGVEEAIKVLDEEIAAVHAIEPYLKAAARNPFKRNKEIWLEFRARELHLERLQKTRRSLQLKISHAEKSA